MKLLVTYATKERKYSASGAFFSNVMRDIEVEPTMIVRSPCGRGVARNRFTYEAIFHAPYDAEFSSKGMCRANIQRKKNKSFNPKALSWNVNVHIFQGGKA